MRQFAADPPIEQRVGDALRERGERVSVAESSTGGLIGALLTDPPGTSDYFDRSLVPYGYDAKRGMLAIRRETLDAHGAVSAPVAEQMAAAARDLSGSTWGLATTGVAGPGGGTEQTPVGTGFVGVAYAGEWGTDTSETTVERREHDGSRAEVRERIARGALEALYDRIG